MSVDAQVMIEVYIEITKNYIDVMMIDNALETFNILYNIRIVFFTQKKKLALKSCFFTSTIVNLRFNEPAVLRAAATHYWPIVFLL